MRRTWKDRQSIFIEIPAGNSCHSKLLNAGLALTIDEDGGWRMEDEGYRWSHGRWQKELRFVRRIVPQRQWLVHDDKPRRWRFSLKMPHMCQGRSRIAALHIRLQDIWQLHSKALRIYKICMQQTKASHTHTHSEHTNFAIDTFLKICQKTLFYSARSSSGGSAENPEICKRRPRKSSCCEFP